jgi:hypothetical protein
MATIKISVKSEASDPSGKVGTQNPLPGHQYSGKDLVKAYQSHPNPLKIKINGQKQTLNGLRVEREHIEQLFANPNIKELFIVFGISPDTLNLGYSDQTLTTVLYGLTHDTTTNPTTVNIDSNLAFDFCDPCPPKCPQNWNSFFDLP